MGKGPKQKQKTTWWKKIKKEFKQDQMFQLWAIEAHDQRLLQTN
jgi:hypothetical protein